MKSIKNSLIANEPNRLSEIYHTAARIIFEKGFDATSMNDIAEAVGMTKAGIYHYIDGKKGLLFAINSYGLDLLDWQVIAPARAIEDAEERLATIITNHIRLITSGNSYIAILVDEVAGLSPANRRAIDRRRRAYLDFVRETLEQLKREGKLQDVDVTVAAFSLFGMILWLSRWFKADGKLTSEDVAHEIQKIALGGLLSQSERESKESQKAQTGQQADQKTETDSKGSVIRLADRLPGGARKNAAVSVATDSTAKRRRK